MIDWHQNPTDPAFVQNPYPSYRAAKDTAAVQNWPAYGMKAVFSHPIATAVLRDRRFGREPLEPIQHAPHLDPFYAIEAHSMLELEPPRHKRLRGLVLRAFTSRRIKELGPEIATLCDDLLGALPKDAPFDLIEAYATPIPIIVICRLLGVPEAMAPQLLGWSNDMVAMYQARRDRALEDRAVRASIEFSDFLRSYVREKRSNPADDLITQLITAEEDGEKLSTDELITTCILLLNAGHEATVHTLGNGIKTLIEEKVKPQYFEAEAIERTVEEIIRFDPPLHVFTRYCYETVDVNGFTFERGDEVAVMLGAANRDENVWENAQHFDPARPIKTNTSFGGGIHFCVGAPLARLELQIAIPKLFQHFPNLKIAEPPKYANLYHFHGLERLMVKA
ncbi:cytochrome P450 [Planktotalea sp.]|uniref:cytochrome P450 n=1 Tax=Planktotalea sp. TaxID=2029877 RepID=UPI00329935DE